MTVEVEHEHWFFAHEDPRWLICECGQYAVRTRNIAGERTLRLIDPPKPAFPRPASAEPPTSDTDAPARDAVAAANADVTEIAV
jgi:hypothetical protein